MYLNLMRLARHLAAAHRLRARHPQARWLDSADAVLDPSGRLRHARGKAKDEASRTALEQAARSMDKVRSRPQGKSSRTMVDEWHSLVEGRWSLVEHVEGDGRGIVLAIDNRAKAPVSSF
jgi:hypothetical protein